MWCLQQLAAVSSWEAAALQLLLVAVPDDGQPLQQLLLVLQDGIDQPVQGKCKVETSH
jgi:hypothetical protein